MKRLFLIPSFYGLLFFSSFYALYRCRLFSYTPLNPEASFIFILAIAGFLLATVLAYFSYGAKENNDADTDDKKRIYVGMIYVFLIIGLICYLKYFRDSVAFFGSLFAYLEILAYSSC